MFFKILISLFILFQADTILIDKIAAVVNDEIITLTDIDKAIQFFPIPRAGNETEDAFYIRVLEELINYRVVYSEYKDEFNLTEEDYEEIQAPVIRRLGSLDKLMNVLEKFDMDWADFEEFIKGKAFYEKVLQEKFLSEIKIDFREIENFYNKEYVPQQQRLSLTPKTLIEMAPRIEKQLKKARVKERSSTWLKEMKSSHKIENKLLQEGK
jgi:hypothetical protein